MLLVLCACAFWYLLYNYRPNNITRTLLSTLHATTVVHGYLSTDIDLLSIYYVSTGYYILDFIHEARSSTKTMTLLKFGIMVHHALIIMTISTLFDPLMGPYYLRAFFIAEISNYPMYLYFYLRETGCKDENKLFISIVLQAVFYFIFRICMFAVIIYQSRHVMNGFLQVSAFIIYSMSCSWFYQMTKKVIQKWRNQTR